MSDGRALIDEMIEAHGGAARWRGVTAVEAELSVDGFLFAVKHRPPFVRAKMRAEASAPRFSIRDYPRVGMRGEFEGDAEVRIVDASGALIERRERPREAFKKLRRELLWDDLDLLYFASYATWGYLTAPFTLARPGFRFEALSKTREGLRRVAVEYPDDVPTHSKRQVMHVGDDGLLKRIDYTAAVVGGWANAAHLCEAYETFDGVRVPTRRRVLPLFHRESPLSFPTLVAIDLHAFALR